MLTEEQIKNLKPGDPLIINGTFVDLDDEGDIEIKISYRLNSREIKDSVYGSPSCVSLPSEHGTSVPTTPRLFKKGDVVQPRSGKTVLASEYGFVTFHELAGQYEVNEDEARGTVTLIVNGHACFVSAFAIELVTPVEELEQYSVHSIVGDNGKTDFFAVRKGDVSVAAFFCDTPRAFTEEQARAAAEAECKRLNAEYRKEARK